ncbi:MAG: hypothetical protein IT303_07985 [Dehalococcoidia bacterium]|nr:hypothetical protein [Dehalococcoidia bacterium]
MGRPLTSRRPSRRPDPGLAAAAAIGVACVTLLLLTTDLRTQGSALFRDPGWDRHLYLVMAREGPFELHLAPFCWRVLLPAIAWASPFPLQSTFQLISWTSIALLAPALYWLITPILRQTNLPSPSGRGVGGEGAPRETTPGDEGSTATLTAISQHLPSPGGRGAGGEGAPRTPGVEHPALIAVLLLYGIGWAPKYLLSDFWVPDSLAFLLLTLAIGFAWRRRPVAFAAVLLAGALTKESALFAALLYYPLHARFTHADLPVLRENVLAALPAVAATLLLRLAIDPANGDLAYIATLPPEISRFPELFPAYNYVSLARDIGYHQRLEHLGLETLHAYTWRALGLVPLLLAAAGALLRPRLALRLTPFLAAVVAQTAVATDTERLIALAFPAVLVLAAAAIHDATRRWAIPPAAFAPLALGTILLAASSRTAYAASLEAQSLLALAGLATIAATTLATRRPQRSRPKGRPS